MARDILKIQKNKKVTKGGRKEKHGQQRLEKENVEK